MWSKCENKEVNVFLDYFRDNWTIEGKNVWYEGYAMGLPTTSNSLESTHTYMKSKHERKSKPLPDFLASQHVENCMVREWSLEREETFQITNQETQEISSIPSKNQKVFHSIPVMAKTNMIETYKYKQRNNSDSIDNRQCAELLHSIN